VIIATQDAAHAAPAVAFARLGYAMLLEKPMALNAAVAENNPARILSGPAETLESHLLVFAAEQARRENRVVALP